jgi:hypothetical protein
MYKIKKNVYINNGLVVLIMFSMSLLLIGGCDNLLKENKIRTPPPDSYYKTAVGFNDLVKSAYSETQSIFSSSGYAILTMFGTDLWTNGAYGSNEEYNRYNSGINPSSSLPADLWSDFYKGITICNTVVSRSSKVEGLSESQKKSRVGEARFLRAWYYFILVQQFGAIPMPIKEVTKVKTTATRTPVAEVYKQIVKDLKFAEQNLPVKQNDVGRVTKPAAEALLARVYLTMAGYPLQKGQPYYVKADSMAKKVIHKYDFHLLSDYHELWVPGNQNNAEAIWTIQFSQQHRFNHNGNNWFLYWTPRYDYEPGMTRALNYDRPWPWILASRFYFNLLTDNRKNDSRYAKSWLQVWIANDESTLSPGEQVGDTAFAFYGYKVPESVKKSKKYPVFDITDLYDGQRPIGSLVLFPNMRKYHDPNRTSINSGYGTKSVIEIRLAEMYLIAAEALFEQGKNSEAVEYINVVRKRAAWPGKEKEMEVSPSQLTLNFILNERARELGAERQRWYTLKRTGKLKERVNKYDYLGKGNFNKKYLVRPIPTKFLDRLTNKDEFKQNPGY